MTGFQTVHRFLQVHSFQSSSSHPPLYPTFTTCPSLSNVNYNLKTVQSFGKEDKFVTMDAGEADKQLLDLHDCQGTC
jgi:hypothetical protein